MTSGGAAAASPQAICCASDFLSIKAKKGWGQDISQPSACLVCTKTGFGPQHQIKPDMVAHTCTLVLGGKAGGEIEVQGLT